MKKKEVYLDHAATTPIDHAVFKAMEPFFSHIYGNPSALYKQGVKARNAVEEARASVAKILNTQPDTIIFTSGGTESNNFAIFGTTHAQADKNHIISISIEHDAVRQPLEHLRSKGFEITYIPVNNKGLVNADDVIKAIRPNTVLITIMYANNEIGSIEPIAEIGRKLARYKKENSLIFPYFHTDACQAAGYLDLNTEKLHVDLLSLNGSKIYGPKGIGILYIRRGTKIDAQTIGGLQEKGRRAGTENVPSIVGLAKALEICERTKKKEVTRQMKLINYFLKKLKKTVPNLKLNGPEISLERLPNNLNIVIPGYEGEALLLYLDGLGISCSTASACNTEGLDTSHVLNAIGLSNEDSTSSLRFTVGRKTSKADMDYAVNCISKILKILKPI